MLMLMYVISVTYINHIKKKKKELKDAYGSDRPTTAAHQQVAQVDYSYIWHSLWRKSHHKCLWYITND